MEYSNHKNNTILTLFKGKIKRTYLDHPINYCAFIVNI